MDTHQFGAGDPDDPARKAREDRKAAVKVKREAAKEAKV
jgi:hypothetical protein